MGICVSLLNYESRSVDISQLCVVVCYRVVVFSARLTLLVRAVAFLSVCSLVRPSVCQTRAL